MRRTHRTGAAVAAAATLLTGAGFALASQRSAPPLGGVTAVSDNEPTTDGEDLDATARQLRAEAKDLRSEIADRAKAARLAGQRARNDATEDPTTSPAARATTTAPPTDATTGASGSGGDEQDGDDRHEDEDEGGDD
ncbi:hypothetical protein [Paractinoplanes durhamensis]|uniref:Uncharacterized protein n=1 Tax=Paractinoplanes durhamensis TaxID=113563 RepID=A0ABQ3ZDB2_9ACTN|nr:hypothetical protein [Actinoplanes durhamensis]GIE07770.1 hypothetical protein Adu01nite_91200 [Actinoplanes durhamensis]